MGRMDAVGCSEKMILFNFRADMRKSGETASGDNYIINWFYCEVFLVVARNQFGSLFATPELVPIKSAQYQRLRGVQPQLRNVC